MSRKMYFGHPVNTYGTELEWRLLSLVTERFPQWEIVNPGDAAHEAGYQRYRAAKSGGMGYFFEEVLPECQSGIFLPFRDGAWGAGVHGEAKFFLDRQRLVWRITHEGAIRLLGASLLAALPVLSVEETRERIRNADRSLKEY